MDPDNKQISDKHSDLVEKAFADLRKVNLIKTSEKDSIIKTLETAFDTEEKITREIGELQDDLSVQKVEKQMLEIIGDDRVQLIKEAFSIQTYQIRMKKDTNDQWVVQLRRGEVPFRPDIPLATNIEIGLAEYMQWASFVIEVIMFVFSCIGIRCDLSTSEMKDISDEVVEMIADKESKFIAALNRFKDKWNKGGVLRRAKAIFWFLKDSYSAGFFWKIANLLIKTMSIWNEIKAVVECTAMLVAAFATEGLALIARIVLAIGSAVSLVQKITNLDNFAEFKKTLK